MYGKFFESTFSGSMFGAGPTVFATWGYIISHCRSDSRVEINPRLVAAVLGTDEGSVDAALAYLSSPDPKSRSKVSEGRRIIKETEYTWVVVNHGAYRSIRNSEELREYNRQKQRESRQRRMSNVKNVQVKCQRNTDSREQITDSIPNTNRLAHSERVYNDDFLSFWSEYPRKVGKEAAWAAWKKSSKMRPPLDRVLATLNAMKGTEGWKRDGGKFIPYPATWLNRGGWDDEPNSTGPKIGRGGMIMPGDDD